MCDYYEFDKLQRNTRSFKAKKYCHLRGDFGTDEASTEWSWIPNAASVVAKSNVRQCGCCSMVEQQPRRRGHCRNCYWYDEGKQNHCNLNAY